MTPIDIAMPHLARAVFFLVVCVALIIAIEERAAIALFFLRAWIGYLCWRLERRKCRMVSALNMPEVYVLRGDAANIMASDVQALKRALEKALEKEKAWRNVV